MEGTRSNAEIIKPVLLKAGLPLALSVAGFMCARIIAAKNIRPKDSLSETHKVNSLETHSQSGSRHEDGSHNPASLAGEEIDSKTQLGSSESKCRLEVEVLGLKSRIEGLLKREEEIEKQFLHFLELKEQESALVDLKNTLMLQIAYAEFLGREVSYMDAESKRFEGLGVEFVRVVNQLEYCKSGNRLLQKKVKRLLRKIKVQDRVIRESNAKIKAREAEILRDHGELETRSNVIKNLEDEVKELRMILGQFQEEKNDLMEKLALPEREKSDAAISKDCAERMAMDEDYNQIVNGLEQLQRDTANEVGELIYLRWSNACLRHQLMRNHKPQDQDLEQEQKKHMEPGHEGGEKAEDHDHGLGLDIDHSFDVSILGHGEGYLGATTGNNHICSKRRGLVQKFRRWIERSENVKSRMSHKEHHDVKCFFGKHFVTD